MKKYLYYIRKYAENFGFVNRVVWLSLKYKLYIYIYSNRKLTSYIKKKNNILVKKEIPSNETHKLNVMEKKIDRFISYLPFEISCLIRSLVKQDIFKYINYPTNLILGVNKNEEGLKAHAWLQYDKYENKSFTVLKI